MEKLHNLFTHEFHEVTTVNGAYPQVHLKSGHTGTLWVLSEQIREERLNHIQNTILREIEQHDLYGGACLLQTKGMVIRLLCRLHKIYKKY